MLVGGYFRFVTDDEVDITTGTGTNLAHAAGQLHQLSGETPSFLCVALLLRVCGELVRDAPRLLVLILEGS